MKPLFYRPCATALMCLALAACGGGDGGDKGAQPAPVTAPTPAASSSAPAPAPAPTPTPPFVEQPLAFTRMDPQGPSSLKTARAVVISDNAAWQALWREHSAGMVVAPPAPVIDFATQTVVAGVIAGCSSLRVSQVVKTASAVEVRYTVLTRSGDATMSGCPASTVSLPVFVTFAKQALPVQFVDVTGPTIPYTRIDGPFSPTNDSTALITDKASWDALWKAGTPYDLVPPPVPAIDFATQNVAMVRRVGSSGCYSLDTFQMLRTTNAVQVQYRAGGVYPPRSVCTANIVSAVALLVFAKQTLPVEFINIDGVTVGVNLQIDSGTSAISADRNAVASDLAAWQALWNEHTAGVAPKPALPAIDFATQSVVALFRRVPDGCSGPYIMGTARLADAVEIRYWSDRPRHGEGCQAGPLTLASFAVIQKTPLKIEFMNTTPAGY